MSDPNPEALPAILVHGVESVPAWFSPLGTVYMQADEIGLLLDALPPEVRAEVFEPYQTSWANLMSEHALEAESRATLA